MYFQDARVGLATLVLWGIFWPLLTAILTPTLGNVFCGICPHGFIGKHLSKLGLQRSFPKKLRGIWGGILLIVVGYWVIGYAMPGFLSSSTRNTEIGRA
ncbi:4Fe-4S binding protein, partial [Arthrospira platensis SPKY1]|nr:4Fe-4S binding protein [Arthrospira platensis SPKY1]